MPSLTVPILPDGALVTFLIAVSGPRQTTLIRAGEKVPEPVMGHRGLVDTGASATVIDSKLVQNLGLMPTGSVLVHTPSTGLSPILMNEYDVALGIAMNKDRLQICEWTMPIIEGDLSAQGIDALIGRDVLARGLMIYHGSGGTATLAF